jgi:hypothetical protein
MDLYVLDENFQNNISIDAFTSLIWTERYSDAGDFSLTVPATPSNFGLLEIDTKLGLVDSEESMIINTQSVASDLLTVTGKSIIDIFNQRPAKVNPKIGINTYTVSTSPSQAIASIVTEMTTLSDLSSLGLPPAYLGVDVGLKPQEQISNLTVVNLDTDTTAQLIDVSTADVFSIIQTLAVNYGKGIKLVVTGKSSIGHSLVFTVYVGKDRTSDQTTYPLVRFSPGNKSFVNTTELYSKQNFKNICYVYASSMPTTVTITDPATGDQSDESINPRMGYGYLDGADTLTDFDRRVVFVDDTDFNISNYDANLSDGTTIATLEALIATELDNYAFNVLWNYAYTKAVDGEVVPQSPYKYGTDYFLGDVIELQGASGIVQKARVTEYIRSQDTTGEKAYPTVAVIT